MFQVVETSNGARAGSGVDLILCSGMDVQFEQAGANGFDGHWLARVEGEELSLRALVIDVSHDSFRFFKDKKDDAECLLEAAVFSDCRTPQQVAAQARIILDLAIGALSFLGRKVWSVRVTHIILVGHDGRREVLLAERGRF